MRLKDGRTRLGYKAEHVVDMETGAPLAVDDGRPTSDPSSIEGRGLKLAERISERTIARDDDDDDSDGRHLPAKSSGSIHAKVVADRGCHKGERHDSEPRGEEHPDLPFPSGFGGKRR
ncbi:MAG: hypothetical protein IPI43_25790 [Sandaracinaceae bacterium]|nr:hypothetical protein [Sandaracinaceae bacterium]